MGNLAQGLCRKVVVLFIVGAALAFFVAIRAVLFPFFMAYIIAYILHPIVDYMETKGFPRGGAIAAVYLIMLLAVTGGIFFLLPAILADLNRLLELIPSYADSFQQFIKDMEIGYNSVTVPEGLRTVVDETIGKIENVFLRVVEGFIEGLLGLFSQVFNLAIIPVVSFYFLLEFKKIGSFLLLLIPVRMRTELAEVAAEMDAVLKKFIRGNLLVALSVAIMAAAGMALIGMDFPLLIGAFTGLMNLIPFFGAIISVIPAMLLALLQSKWLALYVLGIMILVQQIEGNIIGPKILGDCIGLHPLIIIFALLTGGHLWGLLGLFIAVPAAAVLKVLLRYAYTRLV